MDMIPYTNKFFADIRRAIEGIPPETIQKAFDLLFTTWTKEGTVFVAGNGGSASTATHFAADLAKCTLVDGKKRLRATALVDNIPLVSALTNDDGWSAVYEEQLRTWAKNGDLLITISVHGGSGSDKAGPWSQNLLRAVRYMKEIGGKTLGLSGFDGGAMNEVCDCCVVVPVRSTPIVEGFHVVLHHLFAFGLTQMIAASK